MCVAAGSALGADEVFGPPNMLKTVLTPFGSTQQQSEQTNELSPMSIHSDSPLSRSLANRLLPPRVYLPGRMTLGQTAEFIIKGKAGSWAALAMADKNSGAKPIYGHELHLGADRKVVSLGKIPEGGVLSLVIDTPIQGDLIGDCWYFEAAIWSKPDFSDVELAAPVQSESTAAQRSPHANGVLVAAEPDHKRGVRFVPDVALPLQMQSKSLDSGRP